MSQSEREEKKKILESAQQKTLDRRLSMKGKEETRSRVLTRERHADPGRRVQVLKAYL